MNTMILRESDDKDILEYAGNIQSASQTLLSLINDILDFIRSAAPWMAMGLAVAILAVRGAVKIKKGEKQDSNYGLEGMCLGMCFGTALGTALGNNTGVGLSLGMLLGLAIGSCIPRGRKDADE